VFVELLSKQYNNTTTTTKIRRISLLVSEILTTAAV